jgi:hypothetical protein
VIEWWCLLYIISARRQYEIIRSTIGRPLPSSVGEASYPYILEAIVRPVFDTVSIVVIDHIAGYGYRAWQYTVIPDIKISALAAAVGVADIY